MRSHHLIKEVNQRLECPYCHNNLTGNEWNSNFDISHHYKECSCERCGRKISVKVHFNGSGHDCWDKNSEFCKFVGGIGPGAVAAAPLEEKVKEK